jgi:hypothetical protein
LDYIIRCNKIKVADGTREFSLGVPHGHSLKGESFEHVMYFLDKYDAE